MTHGGKREGAGRKPSPDAMSHKVVVRFSGEDIRRIDNICHNLKTTRSKFIRASVKMALKD